MKCLVGMFVAIISGIIVTPSAQAQTVVPIENYRTAIQEAEKLAFDKVKKPSIQEQTAQLLLIVLFVEDDLRRREPRPVQGLPQRPVQGRFFSFPGDDSLYELQCVPRVVRRCGLFKCLGREEVVWEQVYVQVDKQRTVREETLPSVLRRNAISMRDQLLDAQRGEVTLSQKDLDELAKQAYGLSVIAKSPFSPGKVVNGQ